MRPEGMLAAPNRARIKARVLGVEQSATFPDKWQLRLEVLESSDVSGPNFARVGQQVEGFTFGPSWDAPPQAVIEAEVEYIGDARGGQFQLSNVRVV
ncbi:MAG TPA: hypothetical protein VJS44_06580 [Pyrinomonadaceae bacterium]|nr:hypothetical protein [Pyrinomonadaceae bacterium]